MNFKNKVVLFDKNYKKIIVHFDIDAISHYYSIEKSYVYSEIEISEIQYNQDTQ